MALRLLTPLRSGGIGGSCTAGRRLSWAWVLSRDTRLERPCVVCPVVKPVGKPDAVIPHVRFEERGGKTEPWRGLRHRHLAKAVGNSYSPSPIATASFLDSTGVVELVHRCKLRNQGQSRPRGPACSRCVLLSSAARGSAAVPAHCINRSG